MRPLARSFTSAAGAIAPFLAPAFIPRRHRSDRAGPSINEAGSEPRSASSHLSNQRHVIQHHPRPPPLGRWVDAFACSVRDASSDGSSRLPPSVRAELLRIHPRCPEELRALIDGSQPSSSSRWLKDDDLARYISREIQGRSGRLRLHYTNCAPPALEALAALAHICALHGAARSLDVIVGEVTRWIKEREELRERQELLETPPGFTAISTPSSSPLTSSPVSLSANVSHAPVTAIFRARLKLGRSPAVLDALHDFRSRRTNPGKAVAAQRPGIVTAMRDATPEQLEGLWEAAMSDPNTQLLSNSTLAAMIQQLADMPDAGRALSLAEEAVESALEAWEQRASDQGGQGEQDSSKSSNCSHLRYRPIAPLRALIELRLTLLERTISRLLEDRSTARRIARKDAEGLRSDVEHSDDAYSEQDTNHFRAPRPGRRQRQAAGPGSDVIRTQLNHLHRHVDLLARLQAESLSEVRRDGDSASARLAVIRDRALARAAVLGMRIFSLAGREDLMVVEAQRLSDVEATPDVMPKLDEALRVVTAHLAISKGVPAPEIPDLLVWAAQTIDVAQRNSLFLRWGKRDASLAEEKRRASIQLTGHLKHALRASLGRSDEAVAILLDVANRASDMTTSDLFDNRATVDGVLRWATRREEDGAWGSADTQGDDEADARVLQRIELVFSVIGSTRPKPRVRAWIHETLEDMGAPSEMRSRWTERVRSRQEMVEAEQAKLGQVAQRGGEQVTSLGGREDVVEPDPMAAEPAPLGESRYVVSHAAASDEGTSSERDPTSKPQCSLTEGSSSPGSAPSSASSQASASPSSASDDSLDPASPPTYAPSSASLTPEWNWRSSTALEMWDPPSHAPQRQMVSSTRSGGRQSEVLVHLD